METNVIDFTPLINQVMEFLVALVSVGVMWLIGKASSLIGVNIEQKNIARVREAIENGVRKGKTQFMEWVDSRDNVQIKNRIAQVAAEYAVLQVPKVIDKLGYTPDQLERWAYSKIDG